MFPAGNGKPVSVNDRDLKGLISTVNRFCGTKRLASGHLSKSAGLIPDMNDIVKSFVNNPAHLQHETIQMFTKQEKSNTPGATFSPYVFYMEKFAKFGKDFVPKELKRLTNLINADSVDARKVDEFSVRRNVLSVFAEASGLEVPELDNADLVSEELPVNDEEDVEDHPSEEVL